MSTLVSNNKKSKTSVAAILSLLSICLLSTPAFARPNSARKMEVIKSEIQAMNTAVDAEKALNRLVEWSTPKGGDQALLKTGIDALKTKIGTLIRAMGKNKTYERQILIAILDELKKPGADLPSQLQVAKEFAVQLRTLHTNSLANAKSANTHTIYELAAAMSQWAKIYCLPECKAADLRKLRSWKDNLETIRDGVIHATPSASVHERKYLIDLTQKIADAVDDGGQTSELLGKVSDDIHTLALLDTPAAAPVKIDAESPVKNGKKAKKSKAKRKSEAESDAAELNDDDSGDDSSADSKDSGSQKAKKKAKKKAKNRKNRKRKNKNEKPTQDPVTDSSSERMSDEDEAEHLISTVNKKKQNGESGKASGASALEGDEDSRTSDADETEHEAGKNKKKESDSAVPSDHVSAEEAERIFGKLHAALSSDDGHAPVKASLMGTVFASCADKFSFAQETSSDAQHGQQCSQTKGWVITDVDGLGRKCVADIQKTTKSCDKTHPCKSLSDIAGSSFTTVDDKKDFDLVLFTKDPSADQNDKGAWSCENVPNSPNSHFESPTTRALRAQEERRAEEKKKHAEILANVQCQHSFRAIEDIARPALEQAKKLKLITSTDFSDTEASLTDLQFTYLLSEFEIATGTKQAELRTQLQEFAAKQPEYKARLLESLFVTAAKQLEAGEFKNLKATLGTLSKLGLNEEERRQIKRIMSYLHAGELAQSAEEGWQQNAVLRTGYINVLNELAKQVQSDCMGRHQSMEACSKTQMTLSSVQQVPYMAMQRDQQKMMFAIQLQSQMSSFNMMNMNPMTTQMNFMNPMNSLYNGGGFSMNPMAGGSFSLGLGGGFGNFGAGAYGAGSFGQNFGQNFGMMNGFPGQNFGFGMSPFMGNPWGAGNHMMPGGFSPLGL